MKLENQITNLELSKKLKELGVKQESLYSWVNIKEGLLGDINPHLINNKWEKPDEYAFVEADEVKGVFSAHTVAELGEMLPDFVKKKTDDDLDFKDIEKFFLSHGKNADGKGHVSTYTFYYYGEAFDSFNEHADTEANARAKMLIYLVENNLLTKKE